MTAALGLVLISAALLVLTRRSAVPPSGQESGSGSTPQREASAPSGPTPVSGTVSATLEDVTLSSAGRIQAEKFKCVCGCNLILAECTCKKTPGSVDMKQHLQQLVDGGLSPEQIERGMVEKYGSGVLP